MTPPPPVCPPFSAPMESVTSASSLSPSITTTALLRFGETFLMLLPFIISVKALFCPLPGIHCARSLYSNFELRSILKHSLMSLIVATATIQSTMLLLSSILQSSMLKW
uniref:Uncharacterized protein n=1 Tax=Opuntia streptacantha TaxID=393608 RepID=A0A7C8YI38_OPUST